MKRLRIVRQAGRYMAVGVGNTLLTLLVIFILQWLNWSTVWANAAGYAAGFVNSFIWNKQWTFKSVDKWGGSALRFGLTCGVCYLLQLGALLYLNRRLGLNSYLSQVVAMGCYVVTSMAGFLLNKYFTFRKQQL